MQPSGGNRGQPRKQGGRLLRAQPADPMHRQISAVEQRGLILAGRNHDRNRIRDEAPEGEQQRLRAWRVDPVGVVDEHEHRTLLGIRRQQAERRGANGKARLGHSRPQRQRGLERRGLRGRDLLEEAQGRPEQLEQRRERDLGLGLEAARPQDAHPASHLGGVVEQHGLADPGLADQGERCAHPGSRAAQNVLDLLPLQCSPEQHRPILVPPDA